MRACAIVLGSLLALGCGNGNGTGPSGEAVSLGLMPAQIDTLFAVGDTVRLEAVVRDAGGTAIPGAPVQYGSSNSAVATVSGTGVVVSTGNGTTQITATSGTASASLPVHVRQKLAAVALDPAEARIAVGAAAELSASAVDARGNPIDGLPAPTYASSDPSIAAVGPDGFVTGASPGNATVTASVQSVADGTHGATSDVEVVTAVAAATVTLGADTFSPAVVDIVRDGSVTFVNSSGIHHDVDFGIAALDIGVHDSGQNTRTFPDAGRFPYHCNLHAGMVGTVFVH